MINNFSNTEEWLTKEDNICRQDRLVRLRWIASKAPDTEYWAFPGGLISKYIFEESRYCFVYGQFLATIVLGLSYIEHTLAGLFYTSGRDDLERASISKLLTEALDYGWINQTEFENLQRARKVRNPVTHFRKPGYEDTVEHRSVLKNEVPYHILEEDAQHVMEAVLHLLGKNTA